MWEIFYYILIFILGWYLYPFDGRVRKSINAMVSRLVTGIVSAIQNRQAESTKKTQTVEKKETVSNSKYSCSQCGGELIPAGGDMKGYYFCLGCKQMATSK